MRLFHLVILSLICGSIGCGTLGEDPTGIGKGGKAEGIVRLDTFNEQGDVECGANLVRNHAMPGAQTKRAERFKLVGENGVIAPGAKYTFTISYIPAAVVQPFEPGPAEIIPQPNLPVASIELIETDGDKLTGTRVPGAVADIRMLDTVDPAGHVKTFKWQAPDALSSARYHLTFQAEGMGIFNVKVACETLPAQTTCADTSCDSATSICVIRDNMLSSSGSCVQLPDDCIGANERTCECLDSQLPNGLCSNSDICIDGPLQNTVTCACLNCG